MPNKKKWVLASSVDATIFQLPSKTSKAIVIKEPVIKPSVNKLVTNLNSTRSTSTLNIEFDSDKRWPSINGANGENQQAENGGVNTQTTVIDPAQPVVAQVVPSTPSGNTHKSSTGIGQSDSMPPNTVSATASQASTADILANGQSVNVPKNHSNLDIYAHKYVPYWLQAINESFAVTNHAPQIPRPDYDTYRATFAGVHMSRQLPLPELPTTLACPLQFSKVSRRIYKTFWHEILQNEYAAQNAQNNAYSLYGVDVTPADRIDPTSNIYKFKMPGLRESTPRIDLGDIVLIRPFTPTHLQSVAAEAQRWSVDRFGLAPRSAGIEHHAVVWSLLRRDEIVLVRLGKPMLRDMRCNIIIPLQIHKNIPAWRAVSVIDSSLSSGSRSWLTSILFPSVGVLQTTLSPGQFTIDWLDSHLNFEQKRAVQAITKAEYGTVPYLISGPPGTGKTKTLVETALQLLKNPQKEKPHVLVCAPSDAAADTLLIRLSRHLKPHELFRLNNWTRLATEVPGEVGSYCHLDSNQLFSLPDFETVMAFKVVVTTCRDANILVSAGLTNSDLAYTILRMLRAVSTASVESINPLHWTALILDEAAQATEPEALIPLSVIAPFEDFNSLSQVQVPQVIMAGDEYQLGPRLISRALPDTLGSFDTAGLEKSLFQRLFEHPLYAEHPLSRSHGLRPLTREMLPIIRPAFANLIRNYRSHPAILTTSSALFYSDTLIPERPDTSPTILSWSHWPKTGKSVWPVMFYQNTGPDSVESVLEGDGSGSGTLMNVAEAQIVLDLVKSLISHVNTSSVSQVQSDHLDAEDIIVMSPFRAQVNHLRQRFREAGYYNIRIGPLEAFQGLESRVVIMCTTRTRLGQHPHPVTKFVNEDKARNLGVIDEPKSFNVALTRAQEALIVVGNAEVLSVTRDPCWISFLRFCVRNGLCVGEVSWFGKSVNRDGAARGMGKLERALRYAESLEELMTMNEQTEDQDLLSRNGGTHTSRTEESFKFKLKGTMIDLDERMWEMQIGDEEGDEIRAQEEADDGGNEEEVGEDEEGEEEEFKGVDEYEHDNTHVGEPVS